MSDSFQTSPSSQFGGEQDHHAQVLHLPNLHGPAAAISRTDQVLHLLLIEFILDINFRMVSNSRCVGF